MFNVVAKAKYDAWKDLKGTSTDDAKLAYIKLVQGAGFDINVEVAAVDVSEDVTTRPSPPDSPVAPSASSSLGSGSGSSNTMYYPAMMACIGMALMGVAGFLWTTLSNSALFFLFLLAMGVSGFVGAIALYVDENGLISFMPKAVQTVLLETTMLELVVDDVFFHDLRILMVQLMPAFLAHDSEKMYEALSHMSQKLRQDLTTKGLLNFASPSWQRAFLPRIARHNFMTAPKQHALPSTMETDLAKLKQVLSLGDQNDAPNLEMSRAMFRRLFKEVVSKANVNMVLSTLDPSKLQMGAVALSAVVLIQLTVSTESRKFFVGFMRAAVLLASATGASVSVALLLVWMGAKQYKRKMGW